MERRGVCCKREGKGEGVRVGELTWRKEERQRRREEMEDEAEREGQRR